MDRSVKIDVRDIVVMTLHIIHPNRKEWTDERIKHFVLRAIAMIKIEASETEIEDICIAVYSIGLNERTV